MTHVEVRTITINPDMPPKDVLPQTTYLTQCLLDGFVIISEQATASHVVYVLQKETVAKHGGTLAAGSMVQE